MSRGKGEADARGKDDERRTLKRTTDGNEAAGRLEEPLRADALRCRQGLGRDPARPANLARTPRRRTMSRGKGEANARGKDDR